MLFPSRSIFLIVGPLSIHWYGVLYALAFCVGLMIFRRVAPLRNISLTSKQEETMFIATILGVLLGGRLGYVLFYGSEFYFNHPLEILKVWHGGMSSHGGFIGVTLALLYIRKSLNVPLLRLADVLVPSIALGLAFGRFGNFLNQELYGTITSLPWGMYFDGADGLRHPTQLYAIIKDVFLCISSIYFLGRFSRRKDGWILGYFLMMYAVLRFALEYLRDQPSTWMNVGSISFSMGQILCIPLLIVGLMLMRWNGRQGKYGM